MTYMSMDWVMSLEPQLVFHHLRHDFHGHGSLAAMAFMTITVICFRNRSRSRT